jgi:hypothetical protein
MVVPDKFGPQLRPAFEFKRSHHRREPPSLCTGPTFAPSWSCALPLHRNGGMRSGHRHRAMAAFHAPVKAPSHATATRASRAVRVAVRGDHGLGLGAGDETVTGFRSTAPAVGDKQGVETGVGERHGREESGKRKLVGPMFGGGNGGPPRMQGGRGNLEEYGKWRSI